jgi:peptidoglycan/LPS O-acetylase OafA/YrhL
MGARTNRLEWLDVSKGLAILYIAFFHLFNTWTGDAMPSAPNPLVSFWYTLVGVGFHGVGAFLVLSGR